MKRKILLPLVLSAVLATTGCMGAGRPQGEIAEAASALPVEVQTLGLSSINEEFFSLGKVEAGRIYTVAALASGTVSGVHVEVGDVVKAGDVLFELERDDFNTSRTSQISGVKSQLDSAKIQLEAATKSYEDMKLLYAQGAVSKSSLDQAEDGLESARIMYDNAKTAYSTTMASLSSSEDNFIAVSPIDGIVTARTVEEGQFASAQNSVVVSDYDPVKVSISIPGARMDETYVGQPVRIEFPAQEMERVSQLNTLNLSGRAGGFPAEIELENKDGQLLPGMVAEVYLETEKADEAFVIRKSMILEDEAGTYIFIIKDDKAVRVDVEVGLEHGELAQVTGTLAAGDRVVSKGQQYLNDGAAVKVVE